MNKNIYFDAIKGKTFGRENDGLGNNFVQVGGMSQVGLQVSWRKVKLE